MTQLLKQILLLSVILSGTTASAALEQCSVTSDRVVLTSAEQETIAAFYQFMATVGEAVPGPGASPDPAISAQALALAQNAMASEIEIFARANGLNASLNYPGSGAILRTLKFPETADDLSSGETNPNFFNPLPLNISQAWAPWASAWQMHSARMEIYLKDGQGMLYPFKAMKIREISGVPGPKTVQGDLQVPEGIYSIGTPRDKTRFFMALPVLYNPGNFAGMGGQIEIHGSGISVGCLDMGNLQIAQIVALAPSKILVEPFTLVSDTQDLLFSRMAADTSRNWSALLAGNPDFARYPALSAFWDELRKVEERFLAQIEPGISPIDDLIQIDCR
ncbi:MAG: hypothetical protein P4M08_01165 [Oligoflexia bacterium]|nr:hypothetical protein [Oligoflexia bacterium]